jgi:site-specific DNA recombinase
MNEERKPPGAARVALYARVSSEKQAEEGTVASQVAALEQRIVSDGYRVDPEWRFIDDGVSGSTLLRPALERLRDLAATGVVDRLYVLAPDRLARRYGHQMVLLEELQACGVEVVFVNRPLGTTPEDQLLVQVQGVIAEYEHAKILERTRRGRRHAARCGRVSALVKAPYGYRYIGKHAGGGEARYEVIEEEAAVVRQMFDWVAREGCSLREVARRLQREGVRTQTGGRWQCGTIGSMLRNSSYQGQAVFGKRRCGPPRPCLRPRRGQPEVAKATQSLYRQPASEHIRIAVPALVDAELFAAVQERLAENFRRLRASRGGARYLLQGLLVCSSCGYALSTQGGTNRNYRYYACPGSYVSERSHRRVCANGRQRTEVLEAAVWNDVCALLSEPQRLRQEFERRQQSSVSAEQTGNPECLHGSLDKVRQSIGRLIDAYTAGLIEASEFEPRVRRLKERLAKLEGELRVLTEQVKQEQELRLVFGRLEEFADQLKMGLTNADWDQKREILRTLLKRVEVDKDTLRLVYRVPLHPFAKAPTGGQFQDCRARLALKCASVHKRGGLQLAVAVASGKLGRGGRDVKHFRNLS